MIYPVEGEKWLSISEVFARLQSTFEHVELDKQAGYESVSRTLARVEAFGSAPASSLEKLRSDLNEAVLVSAWDGVCIPENGAQFVWQPDEVLYIRFVSGARRHATQLRKSLGYDIEEV